MGFEPAYIRVIHILLNLLFWILMIAGLTRLVGKVRR